MNKKLKNATLTALITFLMLPAGSIAKVPRFEAVQLVRYAIESDRLLRFQGYSNEIARGDFTYDDEFRPPNDPAGPATVDCSATGRVGVTYLLKRRTKRSAENFSVYAYWAHSAIDHGETIQKQQHLEHFADGQDGAIKSSGLALTANLRVDGIVSVRIVADGEVLMENSFNLSACPPLTDEEVAEASTASFRLCGMDPEYYGSSRNCW